MTTEQANAERNAQLKRIACNLELLLQATLLIAMHNIKGDTRTLQAIQLIVEAAQAGNNKM